MKSFPYVLYTSILCSVITVINLFHLPLVHLLHDLTILSVFRRSATPSEWDERIGWTEFNPSHLFRLLFLKNWLTIPRRKSSSPFGGTPEEEGGEDVATLFNKVAPLLGNIAAVWKTIQKKSLHTEWRFPSSEELRPQGGCKNVYAFVGKICKYVCLLYEGVRASVCGLSRLELERPSGCGLFGVTFAHARGMEEHPAGKNREEGKYNRCSGEDSPVVEPPRDGSAKCRDLLNDKYLLTKKIKDAFRKTRRSSLHKLDVILMPRASLEHGVKGEQTCTNCMVNADKSLYALRLRSDNFGEGPPKSIYGSNSSDVQMYYDYDYEREEHIQDIPSNAVEGGEIGKDRQQSEGKLSPPMAWLKGTYKMIDFAKRLFLSHVEEADSELKRDIKRYDPKKLNYTVKEKMGTGAFGEIWYAINMKKDSPFKDVVLKKILIHQDEQSSEASAKREIHFGELLKNCPNVSRFIEFFTEYERGSESEETKYVWLVFANEGYSLANHLFHVDKDKGGMLTPSRLWWSIKKQSIGMLVLKDLMRQILKGVNSAHKRGITHRDIKMENIFVSASTPFTVRIGDWGSAVEYNNDDSLYPPSENEETEGYQPPESLFGHMKRNFKRLPYYDMWGIGIVFLQFVLGTKNPLEVKNKRNEMKLHSFYAKYATPEALKEAIFLQSLSELCLMPWNASSNKVISLKRERLPHSSIYKNNNILNTLHYFLSFNLVHLKNYTLSNWRSSYLANTYNSQVPFFRDSSPLCADANYLQLYDPGLAPLPSFSGHSGEAPYENVIVTDLHHLEGHTCVHCENNVQMSKGAQMSKAAKMGRAPRMNQMMYQHSRAHALLAPPCDDEQFQRILKERDPSGVGLPNANARDLLRRLLTFDYSKRITAEEALNHPWFTEP
ncbi:CMGC/CDK protein kinase [Plasmodium inui San Antonio 1]|uniref:CMGC/CDK protein kinase n=1 Tax=Plasmodium inui San Antonio 1 TaxID=1237626 RepID=W7A387_9APIC|nr:CMGC/CDK protein kinase [Plasmodium inui San Antonio 1]EUD67692.1 CMGC/CDK protein kinase [Plasmodium inui San Antonio 1]